MTTLDVLSAPSESPWAPRTPDKIWLAEGKDIGAGEAASIAKQHVGKGQVLGVRRIDRSERHLYKVKILKPSGRVRVVVVHGKSGEVLN